MDDVSIDEIKKELSLSKRIIDKVNREIDSLKKELQNKGNNSVNDQNLINENLKLSNEHNINLQDISEYQGQLNNLKERYTKQNSEILSLKTENEDLKKKIQERRNSVKDKNPELQIGRAHV